MGGAESKTSGCTLTIHLKPRAKNDRLVSVSEEVIDIAVTAPPVDGKANAHLVAYLAKLLGVPKSACSLIRGQTSRTKVVAVAGLGREEAHGMLTAATGSLRRNQRRVAVEGG